MSDPTFVSDRLAELPVCRRGPQGIAWAKAMGEGQDQEMALLRVAALSSLPLYCPDDALDAAGTWAAIPRLPGEAHGTTTSGYRGRLCATWPTKLKAGTKGGIIDSLQAAGFANVEVFNKHEYDPGAEWWSMFSVQFDASHSTPAIALGTWDGDPLVETWDTPGLWESDATPLQILQLILQILAAKWSYAIPEFLMMEFADGTIITIPLVNKWGDPQMIWGEFVWGNAPLIPVGL